MYTNTLVHKMCSAGSLRRSSWYSEQRDFDKFDRPQLLVATRSISDFHPRFCVLDWSDARQHRRIVRRCVSVYGEFIELGYLRRLLLLLLPMPQRGILRSPKYCIVGFANLHDPKSNCVLDDISPTDISKTLLSPTNRQRCRYCIFIQTNKKP